MPFRGRFENIERARTHSAGIVRRFADERARIKHEQIGDISALTRGGTPRHKRNANSPADSVDVRACTCTCTRIRIRANLITRSLSLSLSLSHTHTLALIRSLSLSL